jgi:hypothetical protein
MRCVETLVPLANHHLNLGLLNHRRGESWVHRCQLVQELQDRRKLLFLLHCLGFAQNSVGETRELLVATVLEDIVKAAD